MAKHAPVVEHSGNTVTVVAPTAEEAMAVAGDAIPGFRTTSIGKVRRGGLAGFFATEMVRLVAEGPACLETAPSPRVLGPDPAPVGAGSGPRTERSRDVLGLATADDLIASLCGSGGPFARGADAPFADRLAAELHRSLHEPSAPAAPPTPTPVVEPTPVAEDLRGSDPGSPPLSPRSPERPTAGPQRLDAAAGVWSAAGLEAVGLPSRLVAGVAAIGPQDEVTWNAALMLALREHCGAALPSGDVMAGPAGAVLAAARHLTVVAGGELADREGAVAVLDADAATLAAGLDGRPLHLVVGGAWRHLATARPAVVSAAGIDDLIDAVRVAVAWDAPLGWVHDGSAAVRVDPFLVAAHVRSLLAPVHRAAPPARRSTGRVAPGRPSARHLEGTSSR